MVTTLYADFNNADEIGRVRLDTHGTLKELVQKNIELVDGMPIVISDGEIQANGIVQFSNEEKIWVVDITGSTVTEVT